MQPRMQADHVEPAGSLARQIDRGFNRVAAADQKQRLFKWLGQQFSERFMKFKPWHV
jgi:hypothetical protein